MSLYIFLIVRVVLLRTSSVFALDIFLEFVVKNTVKTCITTINVTTETVVIQVRTVLNIKQY